MVTNRERRRATLDFKILLNQVENKRKIKENWHVLKGCEVWRLYGCLRAIIDIPKHISKQLELINMYDIRGDIDLILKEEGL